MIPAASSGEIVFGRDDLQRGWIFRREGTSSMRLNRTTVQSRSLSVTRRKPSSTFLRSGCSDQLQCTAHCLARPEESLSHVGNARAGLPDKSPYPRALHGGDD